MDCPTLHGIQFGTDSKKAIERIRRINEQADFLQGMTAGGVFVAIFSTSKPLEASYNIYNTDFDAMAEALSAVNIIRKRRIEEEAFLVINKVSSRDERQFWTAIYNGCKP